MADRFARRQRYSGRGGRSRSAEGGRGALSLKRRKPPRRGRNHRPLANEPLGGSRLINLAVLPPPRREPTSPVPPLVRFRLRGQKLSLGHSAGCGGTWLELSQFQKGENSPSRAAVRFFNVRRMANLGSERLRNVARKSVCRSGALVRGPGPPEPRLGTLCRVQVMAPGMADATTGHAPLTGQPRGQARLPSWVSLALKPPPGRRSDRDVSGAGCDGGILVRAWHMPPPSPNIS